MCHMQTGQVPEELEGEREPSTDMLIHAEGYSLLDLIVSWSLCLPVKSQWPLAPALALEEPSIQVTAFPKEAT